MSEENKLLHRSGAKDDGKDIKEKQRLHQLLRDKKKISEDVSRAASDGTVIDTREKASSVSSVPFSSSYQSGQYSAFPVQSQYETIYWNGTQTDTIQLDICVPCSVTLALSIMCKKKTGKSINFSRGYIYGIREAGDTTEGMYVEKTLSLLSSYGCIPYQDLRECWYYLKSNEAGHLGVSCRNRDNQTLFNDAHGRLSTKSMFYSTLSFNESSQKLYDIDYPDYYTAIQNVIQREGCALLKMYAADLQNTGSDGIVPEGVLNTSTLHLIVLVGWTTINGRNYWIAQNSWGSGWGSGGYCYIPVGYANTICAYDLTGYFPSYTAATGISSSSSASMTLAQNATSQVTGSVVPSSATFTEVIYECERPYNDVVDINSSGVITAKGIGTAYIRITHTDNNYYEYRIYITVTAAAFAWDYPKVSGEDLYITAVEWNKYTSALSQKYLQKKGTTYNFTTVSSGTNISTSIFNQTVNALYNLGISVGGASPTTTITAKHFNDLVTALNSIT